MAKETKDIPEKRVASTSATQNPDDVINIKELFWTVVARWRPILLAMLIGALLLGIYHALLVQPSYQADASIFITDNDSVITVSDLQISSELTVMLFFFSYKNVYQPVQIEFCGAVYLCYARLQAVYSGQGHFSLYRYPWQSSHSYMVAVLW